MQNSSTRNHLRAGAAIVAIALLVTLTCAACASGPSRPGGPTASAAHAVTASLRVSGLCGAQVTRQQGSICYVAAPHTVVFAEVLYCGLLDGDLQLGRLVQPDASSGRVVWRWTPQFPQGVVCDSATVEVCELASLAPDTRVACNTSYVRIT